MSDLHVLQTKSGHIFTPLGYRDVLEVVRDEMGDEVYDYLNDEVECKHWQKEDEFSLLKDEFECYEQENENWHTFVDDISEEIEHIREKIEDNKLTKAQISIELYKVYEKMREEL